MSTVAWIRLFFRPAFLLWDRLLLALFWVNLLGTVYGYEWYWNQMEVTLSEKPIWTIVFVPDSPTASLFFTICVWWMLRESSAGRSLNGRTPLGWMIVQALGVVSSFKYGVWAVGIIIASGMQGGQIGWQDWMLGTSHLAMAVEALLYFRFFRIRPIGWVIAALWVFGNDLVDYTFGVFPWLPDEMNAYIPVIAGATVALSAVSILLFLFYHIRIYKFAKQR